MKPIKPLYVIILIIVFAAAGFYGGTLFQKSQTRSGFARGGGFAGAGGRFGGGQGGPGGAGANGMAPVRGQVVSSSNNSVTVKLTDGSSKIVNLTGQTTISKTTTGSASDLKSGETVTAIGTTNSDGSITAQTVLVGNGNMMFRRPSGSQGSAPTSGQ